MNPHFCAVGICGSSICAAGQFIPTWVTVSEENDKDAAKQTGLQSRLEIIASTRVWSRSRFRQPSRIVRSDKSPSTVTRLKHAVCGRLKHRSKVSLLHCAGPRPPAGEQVTGVPIRGHHLKPAFGRGHVFASRSPLFFINRFSRSVIAQRVRGRYSRLV